MTLFYDFEEEFEYELDREQKEKAIDFIAGEYAKTIKARASETDENITKAIIQAFITDNNLEEETMETYKNELEDYFYDEAQQAYAETMQEMADYECANYDYLHSRI